MSESSATRALRVLVWNEGVHEQVDQHVRDLYPDGLHGTIAAALRAALPTATVRTAMLDDPEHGLTQQVLDETDVLLWWGHIAHERVDDAVVERVRQRVLAGMGLLALHSAHFSKIFIALMGTSCSLLWRNEAERELVWTVAPTHPIAAGVPSPIVLPHQEMYGEFFDIPAPDELVFISSFAGGEVFRSGAAFTRGHGRVFYFSPGDQDYPVYHDPHIQRVLANAVAWAAPTVPLPPPPSVGNPAREWFARSATQG